MHEVGAGKAAPVLVRLTLSLRTVTCQVPLQQALSRETSTVRSIWTTSRLRHFAQHHWPVSCDSLGATPRPVRRAAP